MRDRRASAGGTEFGMVFSSLSSPGHGPDPGVEHLVAEMPDSPLTAGQIHAVQQLACTAALAAIGFDYSVWTRWYDNDRPNLEFIRWTSLGGTARSEVFLQGEWDDGALITRMTIVGTDGGPWQRVRSDIGAA
ncbi:hypothetical protein [Streptomyces sp. NPDC002785]|uniref:hypothetical protein n=1 Tax=Streptomyces sp. NPDC002785 TaxID=3154543 RepID=UPI00333487F4